MVATVGDFKQFRNGAQFGAWLGLTPRQNSSGGKNKLGRITKRGDMYLRMLLIQGAKSAVMTAHKREDPISRWVHGLREKSGWQKAAVALALVARISHTLARHHVLPQPVRRHPRLLRSVIAR